MVEKQNQLQMGLTPGFCVIPHSGASSHQIVGLLTHSTASLRRKLATFDSRLSRSTMAIELSISSFHIVSSIVLL
jgi:hypothetical protein